MGADVSSRENICPLARQTKGGGKDPRTTNKTKLSKKVAIKITYSVHLIYCLNGYIFIQFAFKQNNQNQ